MTKTYFKNMIHNFSLVAIDILEMNLHKKFLTFSPKTITQILNCNILTYRYSTFYLRSGGSLKYEKSRQSSAVALQDEGISICHRAFLKTYFFTGIL